MTDAIQIPQQDEALPPEAMESSRLLEELMNKARSEGATPNTQPIRRPVGRPRGSRNATSTAGGTRVLPPARAQAPVDPNAPTPAEAAALRRAAIEARSLELQERIAEGINETIMLGLTSIGVPSALLYKPGQAPQQIQESEKYTDLAKELTVSPNQARFWARFLAEMENTDAGKKLTGVSGSGNAPLFIYGALSLLTGVQYLQNANNAYKNLRPYVDQYHAAQAQFAQQSEEMRQQAEANAVA